MTAATNQKPSPILAAHRRLLLSSTAKGAIAIGAGMILPSRQLVFAPTTKVK
jgi:hypothetical protein